MPTMNQPTGSESSLSDWAGKYTTDLLGKAQAIGKEPYRAYTGPLSAGESGLQSQAFTGLAGLSAPSADMGGFTAQSYTTPGVAQQYMNPYLQAVLEPQIAEAARKAEINRVKNAARMTQAGAYGGSRQAILEAENQRNMLRNMADITGRGYAEAYGVGQDQFNKEQQAARDAQDMTNRYGLDVLKQQRDFGGTQRDILSEGIAQDYEQFREERDYPYQQVQWMHSLLQGLPVASKTLTYEPEGALSAGMGTMGGLLSILQTLGLLPEQTTTTDNTTTTTTTTDEEGGGG